MLMPLTLRSSIQAACSAPTCGEKVREFEQKFAEASLAGEPERFRALDQQYHFGSVIVHYSLLGWRDLLRWLYLNSNWSLVSVDDVAVIRAERARSRGSSFLTPSR